MQPSFGFAPQHPFWSFFFFLWPSFFVVLMHFMLSVADELTNWFYPRFKWIPRCCKFHFEATCRTVWILPRCWGYTPLILEHSCGSIDIQSTDSESERLAGRRRAHTDSVVFPVRERMQPAETWTTLWSGVSQFWVCQIVQIADSATDRLHG